MLEKLHESRTGRQAIRYQAGKALLALSLISGGAVACGNDAAHCSPYPIYGQNRWPAKDGGYGAAVFAHPNAAAEKIGSVGANKTVEVDGWVDSGEPVYAQDPPSVDGHIWFRLHDESGWVNSAGVRGAITQQNPAGDSDYGGRPAQHPAACELPPKAAS